MQSRTMSAIETVTNVVVGLVVSILAQMVIFSIYDIQVTAGQHVQITVFFTLVSIVRGYTLRRIFNGIRSKT